MTFTPQERQALVEYRLENSLKSLAQAQQLFDIGMYGVCANRLYYTLYYAASALLISKGIEAHTHQGVMSMVHMHFIKTGELPLEVGKTIRKVFNLRQEADYDDFINVEKEDVENIIPKVAEARELLASKVILK